MQFPYTAQYCFEAFVRDAFLQRQHAIAVFFYLEKAYERTRKFGIMRDFHNAGLK